MVLPLMIMGGLMVVGGLFALVLPETLHQHLPQTLQEGESFGKDFGWRQWLTCCPGQPQHQAVAPDQQLAQKYNHNHFQHWMAYVELLDLTGTGSRILIWLLPNRCFPNRKPAKKKRQLQSSASNQILQSIISLRIQSSSIICSSRSQIT